jgi:phage terminase small subunit
VAGTEKEKVMSKDVILYEKQKQKFAKALGKAQDALSELFIVASEIGVSPIGTSVASPETSAASTDAEPVAKETEAKPKKKSGRKSKSDKQPVARANGGAFAEM